MLSILNMVKTGVVGNLYEFKFDFEFDEASTLPTKFVVIEQQKYLIANDSTAKNLSTNTYYKYNSADACWVRSLAKTPTPAPKDNTQITENGNYNIVNNSFMGYNDISVNVEGSGSDVTLIEKSVIENGEYLASEDNADGYSKVTVNVSGGGSEPFIINMTYSNGSYSVDKTVSEVFDAIQNNRDNIIIIADDPKNSSKKYIGKNISIEFVNPFADKHIADLIFSASLPVTDSFGFTLISFHVQAADIEGDSISGTCQIGVISVKSGSITITPEFY